MDGTLAVKQIAENIWTFNESVENTEPGATSPVRPQVDCYLITGSNKAVVIDTLLQETSLYAKVRELTSLPITLLLTHGHGDHAGISTKDFLKAGCDAWLSKDDFNFFPRNGMNSSDFKPLEEGMKFDLGGYVLEAIKLPGHTPGSMLFLEEKKQHLYTGDAIGAGVFWMQIPAAIPLKEFRKNVAKVWDRVKGMDKLLIHTGHRHQAPIQHNLQFLADTIFVTDKIISGEMVGEAREMNYADGRRIKYRTVSYNYIKDYCYNPEKIG